MRATWKSIAFLLIFLAFANNLIASGGVNQLIYWKKAQQNQST